MSIQNNTIPKYTPLREYDHEGLSSCLHLMKDCVIEDEEFSAAYHCYIDVIYDSGFFLRAMYYILVEKDGYCPEWVACYYPEWNCLDPDLHFEGVRFEIGGISDIQCRADVPEEVAFFYLKKACERFMELHPEKEYSDYLQPMLDNWKPL
ncbi:ribonuclease toxin immunity protein CdiI [Glaesserella parasuis]|uniref:ribonuclease toxin immunity protein CdiI n=1 Tax=Glaesserella parasuis TaxID=738 RepID=UPI0027263897|nr:ribonuclease toxin immunity protein CdiI [Glaesserella parasuis]MDP0272337.1 ribonuclease toxin immunity protein CdiI [Glaesserella parasuis]MDP0306151.1 ribonuclease toxin immunity protein CdiI [Glaesserella parasuis]MDP0470856.1 ribonuclease toxin immunity protein CdiI [Glaesserella parasuis]